MSLVHSEEDYRSYQLFIAFKVLQACRKWEQFTRLGGSGTVFFVQLPLHSQDSFHLSYWSDKCFGNSAAKAFFTSFGMRAFFGYLVIEILKQKLENRSNNPDVGTYTEIQLQMFTGFPNVYLLDVRLSTIRLQEMNGILSKKI